MHNQPHSEEAKRRISESNKKSQSTPEMLTKKRDDARRQWKSPEVRAKIFKGEQEHHAAVVEEAEKLRQQGWKVWENDQIRPDMLVRKDNIVCAVEVDFDRNTRMQKYEGQTFFDDVIRIQRHHEHYTAVCQNPSCPRKGKPFEYKIPSSKRKYCSRPCRWAVLKGKVPVGAMVARGYSAERYTETKSGQSRLGPA